MKNELPNRTYKQTARAQAAEVTGTRIIAAFRQALEELWFDEVRLEDVAAKAGVTTQTVIRRFGGKEGLLEAGAANMAEEIVAARHGFGGRVAPAIDTVIAEYEDKGELVLRLLAQEDRYPAIREVTDQGRAMHRHWVGEVFAPWLERMAEPARRDAHDRLVVALDLYVWKLLRIDMQRSRDDLRQAMLTMAAAALGLSVTDFERAPASAAEAIDA